MKKVLSLFVFMAVAGVANAGDMERAAASANLIDIDVSAFSSDIVPVPKANNAVSTSWIEAVKKAYEDDFYSILDLPVAKPAELPAAALKQLKEYKKEDPESLSAAYKMIVKGKLVFVVQQDRGETGMSAALFDASGVFLASGGYYGESDSFSWDDRKPRSTARSKKLNLQDESAKCEKMYETGKVMGHYKPC